MRDSVFALCFIWKLSKNWRRIELVNSFHHIDDMNGFIHVTCLFHNDEPSIFLSVFFLVNIWWLHINLEKKKNRYLSFNELVLWFLYIGFKKITSHNSTLITCKWLIVTRTQIIRWLYWGQWMYDCISFPWFLTKRLFRFFFTSTNSCCKRQKKYPFRESRGCSWNFGQIKVLDSRNQWLQTAS